VADLGGVEEEQTPASRGDLAALKKYHPASLGDLAALRKEPPCKLKHAAIALRSVSK
jgi:hypothetical protein